MPEYQHLPFHALILSFSFSDPYVRVTLKRKNKSVATEQTRKKKKVCYGRNALQLTLPVYIISHH